MGKEMMNLNTSSRWEKLREGTDFEAIYDAIAKVTLQRFEEQKLKGSQWVIGEISEMRVKFVRIEVKEVDVTFRCQSGYLTRTQS